MTGKRIKGKEGNILTSAEEHFSDLLKRPAPDDPETYKQQRRSSQFIVINQ